MPFGAIAGAAIGGLLANSSAKDTNEAQLAEAERNRKFQYHMSSTAYQRKVEDMKKAGLNPLLAGTGGGGQGASTPSGSMAQLKDEGAATVAGAVGGASAANTAKAVGIQQLGQISQAELNSAHTKSAEAQTVKTLEEAKNVASVTALNEAKTREAIASAHSIEGKRGFEADVAKIGRSGLGLVTDAAQRYFPNFFGGGSPNSATDSSVSSTVTDKVLSGQPPTGGKSAFDAAQPSITAPYEQGKAWQLVNQGKPLPKNASPKLIIAYDKYQALKRGK